MVRQRKLVGISLWLGRTQEHQEIMVDTTVIGRRDGWSSHSRWVSGVESKWTRLRR